MRLGLFAAPRYLARAGAPRTLDELVHHDQVGMVGPAANEELGPSRIAGNDGAFVHAVLPARSGS